MRAFLRACRIGRPLAPGHARFLMRQITPLRPARGAEGDDELHVRAAANWLAAAQDSQPDGGVSGRYKLQSGWSSSYPETTGYLVPTLLRLADHWQEPSWRDRAERTVSFLLRLQLPEGAFPGGEVAENRTAPSPFNTAQILQGLVSWHRHRADAPVGEAAARACRWLIAVQDQDGAFRRYFYNDRAAAYSAYLSCWIARYGVLFADPAATRAAGRHLDWLLARQDRATGWFQDSGFDAAQHATQTAFTHTIAYTIAGVLLSSLLLGRGDGVEAAARAADGMLRRFEDSGSLPGLLDRAWRPVEHAQCLTGNCQMALIWLLLYRHGGARNYFDAAVRALDLVKAAQDLDNPNPGLRGGIGGSHPIWGSYIPRALPNWATKFFIDAMLEKRRNTPSAQPLDTGEWVL
jgi:hypothetical protein